MWLGGCVSACLANQGELDTGRRDVLLAHVPELRRHGARFGYPQACPEGFDSFRRLLSMAELIVHDLARGAWDEQRRR
ncbi:hypothetical protein GTY65_39355 [Streptomyces sp. SID8379]|uniref:hypothetical protein n=1 Tax=unclassified Streptomyces TaxID=2593676 RepID=UPI0003713BD3|nr:MULTISPECIES: hypothetical protein [unclassified Streptomyces]MYW70071.1 hypothetical protein [Streptomyces sp. SID8379]